MKCTPKSPLTDKFTPLQLSKKCAVVGGRRWGEVEKQSSVTTFPPLNVHFLGKFESKKNRRRMNCFPDGCKYCEVFS